MALGPGKPDIPFTHLQVAQNETISGGEASEFWGGPNPYGPLTSTPFTPSLRSPAHFFS